MHRSRRWVVALPLLLALPAPAAVITASEAVRHRAQLVTVAGVVSEVEVRPEGTVLRLGGEPGVPVLIPAGVRLRSGTDPLTLQGRTVEARGFVTPADAPLAISVDTGDQLVVRDARDATVDDDARLRARVRALEARVSQLEAERPGELQPLVYGPGRPVPTAFPLGTRQPVVLGALGVPSRVEWGSEHRTLYYPRARFEFDRRGLLVGMHGE